MYLVRLFDGRNLIGTINWSRHPLEGVITQAHNALVRGPATRIEIECRATFRVRKRDKQDENPAFRDWRRA